MNSQQLRQLGIAELEQHYAAIQGDEKALVALERALRKRKVPRARKLHELVTELLHSLNSKVEPASTPRSADALPAAESSPTEGPATDREIIVGNGELPLFGGGLRLDSDVVEESPIAKENQEKPREGVASKEEAQKSHTESAEIAAIEYLTETAALAVLGANVSDSWETLEARRREIVFKADPLVSAASNQGGELLTVDDARKVNHAFRSLMKARLR